MERGAYLKYGMRPASSRRSLRGGQRGSMSLKLGTSNRRSKCAHQGGPVSRGHLRRGRTRLTVGLQRFYLRRGGVVGAERVERGAYLKYGMRPASSRRSLRGDQRDSMSLKLGTSYRRSKCAYQRGPVSRDHLRRVRTRSHMVGRSS